MKNYFDLPVNTQQDLLKETEDSSNLSASAIEKDIWISWILNKLFLLPEKMAFKGGTSLSRVYNVINRYSEDVDITVDYRNFRDEIDFDNISRSQLKKTSEQLKQLLCEYVQHTVLPYLKNNSHQLLSSKHIEITLNENGEQLRFYYPTALNSKNNYIRDHVLIEFGVRNSTEPFETHNIKPILAEHIDTGVIELPSANVQVLSPIRTFWEKATLIHVECHRNRLRNSPDRLSRHWYDLAKLSESQIGKDALQNLEILKSVLEHKKAFFNASYANYNDCLAGKFRLIPNNEGLEGLKKDYQQMQTAGFFSEEPPEFERMIKTLTNLEHEINT